MKKKGLINTIYIFTIIIIMFEEIIAKFIPFIKYYDEFICLITFLYSIVIISKEKKIRKNIFKILITIIIFTIFGLLGNYYYKYQKNKYILIDMFSCIRVYLLYIAIQFFYIDYKKLKIYLIYIAKFIIPIIFVLGIINIFKDIGMTYDYRHGLPGYKFLYSNPGSLVIVLTALLAILDTEFHKNKKTIILCLFSILLTLRGLGIVTAIIYVFVKVVLNKKIKITKRKWIIIGIIICVLGYSQIKVYFFNGDTARKMLLSTSIKIAQDYFPIGTGFGTFGSDVTKQSYSKIYGIYNIDSIYGLSKENSKFLTDNYFPMILAQCGWIGLICVGVILYLLYKEIISKVNTKNKNGVYTIYIYILTSSLGAQLLAHFYGIFIILVLNIVMNIKDDTEK